MRLWLRDSHGAWQQDQQGGSIHVMPPDHEQELGFWLAAVGGHWSAHRLPQYHGAELPGQDSSCKCRRFAIMCRKPTDYRGQQSSRQRQRGTSARICGNSDLPSGREMVSTESYLLSWPSAGFRPPHARCTRLRPDLLRPASLIFQDRVRTARLARTL